MQHLHMYETKFARLKQERDNVAKAKESLELQEPGACSPGLMVQEITSLGVSLGQVFDSSLSANRVVLVINLIYFILHFIQISDL